MSGTVRVFAPVAIALGLAVVPAGSTAETPKERARAPKPPAYSVSTVPGVREIVFRSRILDEERRLLVRLPRGYVDGEGRYPVVVALDAEWHFTTAAADVELLSECSYAAPHPVPPVILVGVVNVDRNRDFTPTHRPDQAGMAFPTSGGAERFRRFLVEEALPIVDDAFRTSPFRILAGWSLGGLFTVETVLSGTPAFDVGLAISPSLWWDDEFTLHRLPDGGYGDGLDPPKRLIVTLDSVERDRETRVARSVAAFAARLDERPLAGLTFESVAIEGMGHNFAPKLAYFYGLATAFSDFNPPARVYDEGLAAVDAYYAALGERYRCNVPVPEDAYGRIAWKLFEAGDVDGAGAVFRAWVERHPRSPVALAAFGSYLRDTGDVERAAGLFREALSRERQAEFPRPEFIRDLTRDLDALATDDGPPADGEGSAGVP